MPRIPIDGQVVQQHKKESAVDLLQRIEAKIDKLLYTKDAQARETSDTYKYMNIPSTIQNISGRQIYFMIRDGWKEEQIMTISGYDFNKCKQLYEEYKSKHV